MEKNLPNPSSPITLWELDYVLLISDHSESEKLTPQNFIFPHLDTDGVDVGVDVGAVVIIEPCWHGVGAEALIELPISDFSNRFPHSSAETTGGNTCTCV